MNRAIADVLLHHDFRTLELEFRIGIPGKRFTSCVGETRWNRLKTALGTGGVKLVTSEKIIKNPDGSSSRYVEGGTTPVWIHKKKVHAEDVLTRPWCVRTSLSLELEESGPPPTKWQHVRNKERFTYEARPWKIDITRVSSVPPIDLDQEHSYEVEVELADPTEFFARGIDEILERGHRVVGDLIRMMTEEQPAKTT